MGNGLVFTGIGVGRQNVNVYTLRELQYWCSPAELKVYMQWRQTCSGCGCSERYSCVHPVYGKCWWAEEELCSMCKFHPEEASAALSCHKHPGPQHYKAAVPGMFPKIIWEPARSEVNGAAELFNRRIYKSLATKLINEIAFLNFKLETKYASQTLYRWAFYHQVTCYHSKGLANIGRKIAVLLMDCREWIKVDQYVFRIESVDGSRQHCYYTLIPELSPAL